MNEIKLEWITEYFQKSGDFYIELDGKGNVTYIDGHISPQGLVNFLHRKMADEIREPGEDWLPTAENINSLPRGMKDYICGLETNADPQWVIRENILMKDLIKQLEAKIAKEEK